MGTRPFQQILLSLLNCHPKHARQADHIGFSKGQGCKLSLSRYSTADFVLDKTCVEKSLETVQKMSS
jgi:hypothetical protein